MAKGDWFKKIGDCGHEFVYHIHWDKIPNLCKECIAKKKRESAERKALWQDRVCRCGAAFSINVNWSRIPDICKDCIEEIKRKKAANDAKWTEVVCRGNSCSNRIRICSDWSKPPTLCQYCFAKLKTEQAKWYQKNCANCNDVFKHNEDWKFIPDYCKTCNEKLYKFCLAQDCFNQIMYKKYWERIPEYCKACKDGDREITLRQDKEDGTTHFYVGRGYINKNGVAIFNDTTSYGKHSHTIIRHDGLKKGEREEGRDKKWKSEEWISKECKNCHISFTYHIDVENIPNFCKPCKNEYYRQSTASCKICDIEFKFFVRLKYVPEKCEDCRKQQMLPINEYQEVQTNVRNDDHVETFTGYNNSGKEGDLFEHQHSHTVTRTDGKVVYHRDEYGSILINKKRTD